MHRSLRLFATCAVLTTLGAAPAFAGPAETKFLASLVGNWSASGTVKGADSGPVNCTLVIKPAGAKTNFSGKCAVKGLGSQDFSGSIVYDDASKKYLATAPGQQPTVGVKSGAGITFTTKLRSIAGTGNSVMKVSAKSIAIDFDIVRSKKDGHTTSHLVFTK